eukprot:13713763-Ditylum_brightwellii.AAC.1
MRCAPRAYQGLSRKENKGYGGLSQYTPKAYQPLMPQDEGDGETTSIATRKKARDKTEQSS